MKPESKSNDPFDHITQDHLDALHIYLSREPLGKCAKHLNLSASQFDALLHEALYLSGADKLNGLHVFTREEKRDAIRSFYARLQAWKDAKKSPEIDMSDPLF